MDSNRIKDFLDSKYDLYNRPYFIENDPILIPHQFTLKQDIEIMGFLASILAWGQRKTIINKCRELIDRMDGAPYDFIKNHKEHDLAQLCGFKHRTFNDTDLLYFVAFFKQHYAIHDSLEKAFTKNIRFKVSEFRNDFLADSENEINTIQSSSAPCYGSELTRIGNDIVEDALNNFRSYFFSLPDYPLRTKKHISAPKCKSACKRLNMFLRWMVRKDDKGVDFGIWNSLNPADLICPTDIHVERVSRKLGLITRRQLDWATAEELTANLRKFDPLDPVKYDFALFGLGIEEQFEKF